MPGWGRGAAPHEGGVSPDGDVEEDGAALAGGQGGEVALADTQGRGGLGGGEVEEHGHSP